MVLFEELRIKQGLCYTALCSYYKRKSVKGYVITVEIVEDDVENITAENTADLITNVVQQQYDFIKNEMTLATLTHLKNSSEKKLTNEMNELSFVDFKKVFETNEPKKLSIQVQSNIVHEAENANFLTP